MEIILYQDIWEMLAKDWEATFSPEVVRRHTPEKATRLLECIACGLQFFHPAVPGDEEFYDELASGSRYEYIPWKWEFDWAKERLSASMSVLDVGCGKGMFLAGVKPLVRRVQGVELSHAAAAAAGVRGVDVAVADPMEFARSHPGEFDAVCAFHLVEHLAAPVPCLRSFIGALRPGGSLFLSMPNRMRSAQAPLEPLDCPPHHLARWGPAQLKKLGEILGVRLEELAFEPVEISVPREELREAVRRAAAKIPGAGNTVGRWAGRAAARFLFPGFLCAFYRRSGILERLGYFGHSMAVRYARVGS